MSRKTVSQQAIEDYLKTIYQLAQEESPVGTNRLAEARGIKPASVTNMIQKLARLNLVNYEKHRGVTLTPAGEKIALEMIRHHRLLELYLTEALGFSWDEVHDQAEVLEHVISEQLEARLAAALGDPAFDPHGAPIPTLDGEIPSRETVPLTALQPGEQGVLARVMEDSDSELLVYLAERGLVPGAELTVVGIEPFEGPVTVEIAGTSCTIGHKIAGEIHVTRS